MDARDDRPADGDLLITATAGRWVVAIKPEPGQIVYATRQEALSAAMRYSLISRTTVWQSLDGTTYRRVAPEAVHRQTG